METSGRRWRFLVSGSRLNAARPFGNLATRGEPGLACGPMALRRRLTAGLPLSRTKRLQRCFAGPRPCRFLTPPRCAAEPLVTKT